MTLPQQLGRGGELELVKLHVKRKKDQGMLAQKQCRLEIEKNIQTAE